jgi:hypothetical protein
MQKIILESERFINNLFHFRVAVLTGNLLANANQINTGLPRLAVLDNSVKIGEFTLKPNTLQTINTLINLERKPTWYYHDKDNDSAVILFAPKVTVGTPYSIRVVNNTPTAFVGVDNLFDGAYEEYHQLVHRYAGYLAFNSSLEHEKADIVKNQALEEMANIALILSKPSIADRIRRMTGLSSMVSSVDSKSTN